jgi:hypothetical protein
MEWIFLHHVMLQLKEFMANVLVQDLFVVIDTSMILCIQTTEQIMSKLFSHGEITISK